MAQFISFRRNKGQAFAPDFMASAVMWGFMVAIFFISWNTIIDAQISDQEDQEMYIQAERSLNHILNSEGSPENWDSQNVEVLGLAERPHVLNEEKILEMKDLETAEKQAMLRTVGYQILIDTDTRTYEIGSEPSGDQVFTFRRQALVNQSGELNRAEVRYTVWE